MFLVIFFGRLIKINNGAQYGYWNETVIWKNVIYYI